MLLDGGRAGCAAAGGARCFTGALKMGILQQNLGPRGPVAQRSGAGAAAGGRKPCSATARPAPRRVGVLGDRGHGRASPEQGLGAAPPAPGARGVQSRVSAGGAGAPRTASDLSTSCES